MNSDLPEPPYYAVIFTSVRTQGDNGYAEMSKKMTELASKQDGFLGIESARDVLGITVSYWRDLDSVQKWKVNSEHTFARTEGRNTWYNFFKVRIAKVEREYTFKKNLPLAII